MKTTSISLIIILTGAIGLTSCNTSDELDQTPSIPFVNYVGNGTANVDIEGIMTTFPAGTVTVTTTVEDWLKYMREEEKVAQDLYLAFNRLYNHRTFNNISRSEQNHMNAILRLMNYYQVEDPASTVEGTFTNPDLQSLYNELLAMGQVSLKEALKVGVLVEETDIADLEEIYTLTPPANVKAVADALKAASNAHLRAFNFALSRL